MVNIRAIAPTFVAIVPRKVQGVLIHNLHLLPALPAGFGQCGGR